MVNNAVSSSWKVSGGLRVVNALTGADRAHLWRKVGRDRTGLASVCPRPGVRAWKLRQGVRDRESRTSSSLHGLPSAIRCPGASVSGTRRGWLQGHLRRAAVLKYAPMG